VAERVPDTQSILGSLSKDRLVEFGRFFDVSLTKRATKDEQVATLLSTGAVSFDRALGFLQREELKAACRAHGLDDAGRARGALVDRLVEARGTPRPGRGTAELFKLGPASRYLPTVGDIVQVRHRQWLVEEIVPPPEPQQHTLVKLVCLDDDNQGRSVHVLWELELGAKVLQPEAEGLGAIEKIDPPRHFAAYLHALKWHSVSATDKRLFQAPFRAGIKLMNHQLTPLKKALDLPRANLFIADDVGLGKTIEAGLVLSELLLRQRVEYVLIACPASIALQWRDEMKRRFGLHFEIYNRAFIARRRQERGFGVNPWTTHNRFIVSYPLLRRPEYRDPLVAHLGDRLKKSLLILDEAHTAAPATNQANGSSRARQSYAVDSRVTRVVRDVAKRFENRLFLSATPHNGHSNSFSALLEILDPQRFTRGVPVTSTSDLATVMVRRLKSDLREIGHGGSFPDRKVVQIDLQHDDGSWRAKVDGDEERLIGEAGEPFELTLAQLLSSYRKTLKGKRGHFVFSSLQKRLLSSVEAFHRTLHKHAQHVAKSRAAETSSTDAPVPRVGPDDDEYGTDDETAEALDAARIAKASRGLAVEDDGAQELLDQMLRLSGAFRGAPDGKAYALVEWIRRNQCPAAHVGGATLDASTAWSGRRVIIFTEFAATKRYLHDLLTTAVGGTEAADQRIMHFHGAMSDAQREEVQRAFNSPPESHPVRILLATDAAREGVNLQGHCADLFHYDIPWNPARMEQRNGRIDRTLQREPEVRCMYFFYPQRLEDPVLAKVVRKVEVIQRELGSLSDVVFERLGDLLSLGIDQETADKLEAAEQLGLFGQVAQDELERPNRDLGQLKREIDEAGEILNSSRRIVDFEPTLLKDAIDVGLELSGQPPLAPANGNPGHVYTVPELPDSWAQTLDSMRPAQRRDEPPWEWRKRPPMPVVFRPPEQVNAQLVHLHLQHPFVRRLMSRFLSQGYSAHDLSRVTVVRNPHDSLVRVIAFGRLSLFGPGATRLHDQVISIAAKWLESGGPGHLKPFAEEADRKAVAQLESTLADCPTLEGVSAAVQEKLRQSAPGDFARLWDHIKQEADSEAHRAAQQLAQRGLDEAEALKQILTRQRTAIHDTIEGPARQLTFGKSEIEKAQKRQLEHDLAHMRERLAHIDAELASEPDQLRALYEVVLTRLEPIGLVYLWPTTRG
jgi:hypothetical protein